MGRVKQEISYETSGRRDVSRKKAGYQKPGTPWELQEGGCA